MIAKTSCGGLLERDNVCLVRILGTDWKPGQAEDILQKFAAQDISLSYLIIEHGVDEDHNMSLCVNREDLDRSTVLLTEIRKALGPSKVVSLDSVVILTLYGPHFMEKPALASRALTSLFQAGIKPHSLSSSINSISLVVSPMDHAGTVASLSEMFDWPE